MGKSLWTDHAVDLSRFVLGEEDVKVIENLDTEQQTPIARQTDITKRIRVSGYEAILHVELQLRDSTRQPMWARNAQYQGYLVGEHQIPVYSNVIYFHPTAGRNDTGRYGYSWGGYEYTLRYKVIRLIEIEGQAVLELQDRGSCLSRATACDMGAYSWGGYEYTLRYKVIRLIEIEGQAVLELQAPGLLPFTPLMQPPAGMVLERWVQECKKFDTSDQSATVPLDLLRKW